MRDVGRRDDLGKSPLLELRRQAAISFQLAVTKRCFGSRNDSTILGCESQGTIISRPLLSTFTNHGSAYSDLGNQWQNAVNAAASVRSAYALNAASPWPFATLGLFNLTQGTLYLNAMTMTSESCPNERSKHAGATLVQFPWRKRHRVEHLSHRRGSRQKSPRFSRVLLVEYD